MNAYRTSRDDERSAAVIALLKLVDPPDLCRGYRYVQARDPKRNPDEIKRQLGTAYVERRRQAHADLSTIVSLRRSAKLRLVAAEQGRRQAR